MSSHPIPRSPDVLIEWQRFVGGLPPGNALRPAILESWRRSRAAGVVAESTRLETRRIPSNELQRRLGENAELLELARPHLEWISSSQAGVPHVAYLVDRDGIVLHSTGTDATAMDAAGLRPGFDWSETRMGTNGAGTALACGEAVAVDGPEHFVQALHGYSCMGAPVLGPNGEVIGAIDLSISADAFADGRLAVVAHAAYAIGQESRYRDSLRRTSGQLDAERRAAEERAHRLVALEAFRESEARFRGAFDHAVIAMSITSPDGRWVRVNHALCRMLGYAEEELIDRQIMSITHPDDVAPSMELIRRALAGEADRCQMEKRVMHKQGHPVWVALDAALVRGTSGEPLYFVAQLQDVTERKCREVAMREAEARYERHVANAPGMVYQFVYRADGSQAFSVVSEASRALVGVAPEAILNDPDAIFGLVHPEDQAEFSASAAASRARLAPWSWEGRVVLPTGEEKRIQAASRLEAQPDGSVVCNGVLMDITERRQAAARLEESEQRYRSLFEEHPDAVFSLDLDGSFLTANAACEATTGYPPEQLLGQSFGPLVVPEHVDMARAHFAAAVAGEAQRFEVAIRHHSGRRVELDLTSIPIVVRGTVVGVYGIAGDLTERRALEARLRQSQKMEAVGQLAGGVAHDFNNILAAITGFAGLLMDDFEEKDARRSDVEEILKSTRRAAGLIRQLLAFSRTQVLQPRALDLNRVVTDTVAMLRPLLGAPLRLVTLPARTEMPVYADRTQLEQVLMNLILNARDAMPEGGALTIEVAGAPAEEATPPSVTLSVSDTGRGMAPEVAARAFEPFFTTKARGHGTGLGLATVHGIVEQSGGTVRLESQQGRGTTITISLPLTQPAPAVVAPVPESAPNSGRGTVLVVEDEDTVRTIAQRVLERAGFRVLTARHGADALRVLGESDGAVDVLLSDVIMPEIGGVELAVLARERVPGLPVILMSGYTDADIGPAAENGLVNRFLQKPFNSKTLLDVVHSVTRVA